MSNYRSIELILITFVVLLCIGCNSSLDSGNTPSFQPATLEVFFLPDQSVKAEFTTFPDAGSSIIAVNTGAVNSVQETTILGERTGDSFFERTAGTKTSLYFIEATVSSGSTDYPGICTVYFSANGAFILVADSNWQLRKKQ